ncbi:MAG: tRNA lysidine(34) synthetase TilS [Ruminococcaceae bacterium]|nr:tRNA lysidine(34) synthetase TilS [Oscillospiraceae bacterium]
MLDIIRGTVQRYGMLRQGDCVIAALSGGADSVALLHALQVLSQEYGIALRAVHVNHCIRGGEADRDQHCCEQLCARLGIDLRCFRCDVPAWAAERGIGMEEAGREVRYRCFDEAAADWRQENGGDTDTRYLTATAHTLSDNAETVLFNMARGSGTAGMRGIPPVRGSIVRPLIGCTRRQIEAYCAENSLEWVTDSTNSDTEYSRNLIRAEVIPLLRRLNPSLDGAMGRLSHAAREDDELLTALAQEAEEKLRTEHGWYAEGLAAQHPALRHRIIMDITRRVCALSPDSRRLELMEACLERGSGGVQLSDRWTARVSGGCLHFDERTEEQPADGFPPVEWQGEPTLPLPDGRIVSFRIISADDICKLCEEHKKTDVLLFKNALDYDIINNNAPERPLLLRTRREGDRFSPAGRGVSKSVKKLLCEQHIPQKLRGRLVFIQQGDDLVWIEGIGGAQGYAAQPQTKRLLLIDIVGGGSNTHDFD